jgi:hypothetical protein
MVTLFRIWGSQDSWQRPCNKEINTNKTIIQAAEPSCSANMLHLVYGTERENESKSRNLALVNGYAYGTVHASKAIIRGR